MVNRRGFDRSLPAPREDAQLVESRPLRTLNERQPMALAGPAAPPEPGSFPPEVSC